MRHGVLVAALLGACWTGADPATAPPAVSNRARESREPLPLRVKLERTPCFGECPAYTVVVYGDGRVEWTGHSNVAAVGSRQGRVTRSELEELSRRIDRARFFERNEHGDIPAQPECTTTGSMTSCTFSASVSICTDTSHAVLTVKRDGRIHTIDNDHCIQRPELDALEDFIDRIAATEGWIGS